MQASLWQDSSEAASPHRYYSERDLETLIRLR
jgi:hypothetical protein